jgi:hypothetical protein
MPSAVQSPKLRPISSPNPLTANYSSGKRTSPATKKPKPFSDGFLYPRLRRPHPLGVEVRAILVTTPPRQSFGHSTVPATLISALAVLMGTTTDLNAFRGTSPCAAFSGKLGAGVRHRESAFFCRRTNPRRVGEINRASSQAPSAARISHQPNP